MSNSGYILVEGINIYGTVFDTGQLSVIRGSGFLLANAISELPRQTIFKDKLRPLSQGASSGLFEVALQACPAKADYLADVAKQVAEYLSDHEPCSYFTFAVAQFLYEPKDHSKDVPLSAIKTALSAKIRRQQLQQLSSAPDPIDPNCVYIPCEFSGVRAARKDPDRNDAEEALSDSVRDRLREGQTLKGSMYLEILQSHEEEPTSKGCHRPTPDKLEALKKLTFVNDLKTLGHSKCYETLNNKMAVIYLDGNGFGKIQRSKAKNAEDQRSFDRQIRDCRADFLFQLLTAMRDGVWEGHKLPDGCLDNGGGNRSDPASDPEGTPQTEKPGKQVRLETLLWGGDEMTLVVPAWLGFDVLQLFYAVSADWRFGDADLTHAGGIVFCHAHSPIAEMRRFATRLADDVKQWMRENHHEGNWFDYLVLESIDYPTEPTLPAFRQHRYGPIASKRKPIHANPEWLKDAGKECRQLLTDGDLSRGQVFSLARAIAGAPLPSSGRDDLFPSGPYAVRTRPPWAAGDVSAAVPREDPAKDQPSPTALERWEKRLVTIAGDRERDRRPGDGTGEQAPVVVERLERLAGFLGLGAGDLCDAERRAWLWLHLAELWDYLVPERDRKSENPDAEGTQQEEDRP